MLKCFDMFNKKNSPKIKYINNTLIVNPCEKMKFKAIVIDRKDRYWLI